jgi:tRNA-2-methylthio-N6-dimethylallyladenosine synthase
LDSVAAKVFIKTYGCQMNERDSEAIAARLQRAGYEIVEDEGAADVIILNTCSVREQAEIKALGKSGYLAKRKRKNPGLRIAIVGCMAESLGAELFRMNPAVDLVVGPRRLRELPAVLRASERLLLTGESQADGVPHNFDRKLEKHGGTAFLSIMSGCNMRCSYCIVPRTRGRETYRPMDDVVAEARFLVANGTVEITLLGQIVNNYGGGATNSSPSPFVRLLERLNEIDGLDRIRYMSPHPAYFSEDLIAAHGNLSKLCPSVHLPVQSGSNRVLKAMGRHYTREKILRIVESLRANVPDIGISTDIIVGYAGETSGEFEETLSLFDEVRFNMAFVFKYSPRPGTRAAAMADDVSDGEKDRRNAVLLRRVAEMSAWHNRRAVGETFPVLVEGHAKRGENAMFGRTANHSKVLFAATESDIGKILPVTITGYGTAVLHGTVRRNYTQRESQA